MRPALVKIRISATIQLRSLFSPAIRAIGAIGAWISAYSGYNGVGSRGVARHDHRGSISKRGLEMRDGPLAPRMADLGRFGCRLGARTGTVTEKGRRIE